MNAFFEVSIRCSEITEEGKVKKHRKKYLLDSVSFSEAEARIIEELKEMIQGDFCIEAIKKSNITELVESLAMPITTINGSRLKSPLLTLTAFPAGRRDRTSTFSLPVPTLTSRWKIYRKRYPLTLSRSRSCKLVIPI